MKYIKRKLSQIIDVDKIVTIHYFELSKNFNYPAEEHNFWEFHYIDKGQAISSSNDKEKILRQGEIVFHAPMSKHQLLSDGNIAPNVCVFSFDCNSNSMELLKNKVFTLNSEQRFLMQNLLTEANNVFDISINDPKLNKLEFKEEIPLGGLQMIKLKLEEFIISILRGVGVKKREDYFTINHEEYKDEIVNKIIEYLYSHVSSSISLDDICKELNYSKTYICTHFIKTTKKTIKRYYLELKISVAKKMICEKSQTRELFSQISDSLGFSSPTYFYYTFKKYTNMTPNEYSQSVHKYDVETTEI